MMGERSRQRAIISALVVAAILTLSGVWLWLETGSLAIAANTIFSAVVMFTGWSAYNGMQLVARKTNSHPGLNLFFLLGFCMCALLGVWIAVESVIRSFFRLVDVRVSLWAPIVLVVMIILQANCAKALSKLSWLSTNRSLDQMSFLYDTSKWMSILTLASLFFTYVGSIAFFIQDLLRADGLVALGFSLVILLSAIRLGLLTQKGFQKGTEIEIKERVTNSLEQISGLSTCTRLLVVLSIPFMMADLDIETSLADNPQQEQIMIGEIEAAVHRQLLMADITLHVLPPLQNQG